MATIPNETRFRSGDSSHDILRKILATLHLIHLQLQQTMINNPSTVVPVTAVPLTDHSGTITAANTSQQIAAANTDRNYFIFMNVSDKPMWINFGAAATLNQPSFRIDPGGSMTFEGATLSSDTVNVIGPNVGKAFTAKEGTVV